MNKLKIGALYLLLSAGGLWHVLGVFQEVMRVLASPIMIGLGVWLFWECWRVYPQHERPKYAILSIGIVVASFGVEWLGVQTGQIFGSYLYGQTLQPSIGGVPISIGSAWFVMLIASTAVAQRITRKALVEQLPVKETLGNNSRHLGISEHTLGYSREGSIVTNTPLNWKLTTGNWPLLKAFLVAALMVCFDLLMEPAAVKLDYWTWMNDHIPLRNYLMWFGLSFIFATIGLHTGLFRRPLPQIVIHFYFAQMIYFGLVVMKG